jgi:predicted ATPase
VVIAEATQRLAGGLFELADLGGRALKGFGGAVRAWRVVGEGGAESRFAARSAKGLTPFVGREHELGMLLDRFEQAKDGEGQVLLLSGEPGIGKSRLAHGLIERLADEPHTRLRFYCSPYHASSALHPMIEQIERAAGFLVDDPSERRLDKLEALLGQGTDDPGAVAPLFAALLAIPPDGRYAPLNLPAQRQRELTIAAMVDQVSGLAAQRPLLMILEDAHWIDPTTTEVFERLIARSQTLPLLLLITFRPEFAPPWTSYPHMTSLTLNRLGRRHSAEMIAAVAGGKPLPDEVLAQIWAKTEGVPLFVEELTQTVLESGLLEDRGDRFALSGPLPPLAIPATLHDSLMARLDRLAPVREVAQIGATIGREFSYRLLAALSPLEETALQEALSNLVGSELVFRRGTIPDATYSFKHAFVQDAAYESLLKSRRQQLHARIGKMLLERFPETADTKPEIVAHHFAQAGLVDDAVRYLERAGELAKSRSAMAEAAAHFASAIELLSSLADTTERKQRELGLRSAQGAALIAAKGLAAPEVAEIYARAQELCGEVGDEQLLFAALCGQYWFHSQKGELDRALATAEEVLRLAERQEDTAGLVIGHRIVGTSLFHLGRLAPGRKHLEQAVALYDPARHATLASLYTFDPLMAGLAFLSWLLLALGYPEQARRRSLEAIDHARALDHPHSVAHALANACLLNQLCRDRQAVEKHADALIALAAEQEFRFWLAIGTIMQGWALAEAGRADSGVEKISLGLDDYRATGAALWSPCFLALLADGYGRLDQAAAGLDIVGDAIEVVQSTGARWYEAELHRLRGDLLMSLPDHDLDVAEASFETAIALARDQEAKMWELRAATSLARCLGDRGRAAEACDLLAPVVGWFTEGLDLPDLREAAALLDRFGLGADMPASNA